MIAESRRRRLGFGRATMSLSGSTALWTATRLSSAATCAKPRATACSRKPSGGTIISTGPLVGRALLLTGNSYAEAFAKTFASAVDAGRDRPVGDVEARSDLTDGEAFEHQAQHLELAERQLAQGG